MTDVAKTHSGRIVLVTGAGRGIGRTIALRFAAAGASVAVFDALPDIAEDTAHEIVSSGGKAIAVVGDVSDFPAVDAAGATIADALGTVDTVINNAGISPKHDGAPAPITEMDPSEWRRVVDVNLTGAFNTSRVFAGGMKAAGFGSIVNQSSVSGQTYVPFVGAHYPATKAALIGLTRHLAGELGPWNINVNAMAPGRIETSLMKGVDNTVNEAIRAATPMRRFGTPDDVAALALFLTSQDGHFVTGQVCDVSGGWMLT